MKRGKKYQDAVKAYDRSAQYDVAEAIDLVKKNATAKFDETIELHLERAVMDVTQSSRSVVRLYCHTEQVRPLRYWFSQGNQGRRGTGSRS